MPCRHDELRYVRVRFPYHPAGPAAKANTHARKTTRRSPPLVLAAVRRIDSGAWYYVMFPAVPAREHTTGTMADTSAKIIFVPSEATLKPVSIQYTTIQSVLGTCRTGVASSGTVIFPNLWRPPDQTPAIELVDTTKAILVALQQERISLDSLRWQQLEDVVAELLRGRGLTVDVTPRTADGGRDVIARGELIPGEPTVLAVEVKHKAVVTLPEARNALWANRDFPLTMIATSGRFSGGVVREKHRPEVYLRLLLKDGVALRQWFNEYPR